MFSNIFQETFKYRHLRVMKNKKPFGVSCCVKIIEFLQKNVVIQIFVTVTQDHEIFTDSEPQNMQPIERFFKTLIMYVYIICVFNRAVVVKIIDIIFKTW